MKKYYLNIMKKVCYSSWKERDKAFGFLVLYWLIMACIEYFFADGKNFYYYLVPLDYLLLIKRILTLLIVLTACAKGDLFLFKKIRDDLDLHKKVLDYLPEMISLRDHEGNLIISNQSNSLFLKTNPDSERKDFSLEKNSEMEKFYSGNRLESQNEDGSIKKKHAIEKIDKEGRTSYLEVTEALLKRGTSGKLWSLKVVRDITDFKAIMELVSHSEERYRTVFNSVNDVIVIHDPFTGKILDINKKGEELYGYSKDEITGMTIGELSANNDAFNQEEAKKRIDLSLKEEIQVFEWLAKDKKGNRFWVEVQLKKIELEKRQKVLAVVRDITLRKAAERKIRSLAKFPDENPNAVIRADRDGNVLYLNRLAERIGKDWARRGENLILPRKIREETAKSVNEEVKIKIEYPWQGKIFQLNITPIVEEGYANIYFEDITEEKEAKKQLELAKITFDHTGEAIMITDGNGVIVNVNKAFSEITGYAFDEIMGKTPAVMKSGKHDRDFYGGMWKAIKEKGLWQGEVWDRKKNGEIYPKWLTINAVQGKGLQIEYYVGIFSDITKMKKNEEYIDFLAHYDILTEIPNRLLFKEKLSDRCKEAKERNMKIAVLFIDLDRFKTINDTLGYSIGDNLLIEVTKRLKKKLRSKDVLGRNGGDEFLVLLYGLDHLETICLEIERFMNLFETPFKIEDYQLYASCSIGVSFFPDDGSEVESILKNAETAMFEAKSKGKNTYRFFSKRMEEKTKEFLKLEMMLREALALNEFRLYYQAKMDIQNERLVGFEALIRWMNRDEGIVSPGKFIPVAEETGLIIKIGYWVIKEACRVLDKLYKEGYEYPISINVSAVQLRQSDFLEKFMEIVERYEFPKKMLDIEITESILMTDIEKNKKILKILFEKKINISIDDFGTGYSSLSYLKDLSINTLKIDKSFIDGIPREKDSNAIVRSIVALGRNLELNVLAEGVETIEQLEFLKKIKCGQVQGYFYSKPLPLSEIYVFFKG